MEKYIPFTLGAQKLDLSIYPVLARHWRKIRVNDTIRRRFFRVHVAYKVHKEIKDCRLCAQGGSQMKRKCELHHFLAAAPVDLLTIKKFRQYSNPLQLNEHMSTEISRAHKDSLYKYYCKDDVEASRNYILWKLGAVVRYSRVRHEATGPQVVQQMLQNVMHLLEPGEVATNNYHLQTNGQI